MNAELAAMNKISKAVESSTADLDEGARERVLGWFVEWTAAQLRQGKPASTSPTVPD